MRCKNCNKKIESKGKNGRKKSFCNRECYLEYSTIFSKKKICLFCGKEFNEKNYKNKANFRKQKYCSKDCRMNALNSDYVFSSIENEYNLIF